MRFSTALAFLVQAHPIVSDAAVDQLQGAAQVLNSRFSTNLRTDILHGDHGPLSHTSLKRIKRKFAGNSRLKNEVPSNECDPESIDLDNGVLSCDSHLVCIPQEQSTLGGFCVPRLSAGVASGKGETGTQCDPSSTDADIGILSCGNDEFCMKDASVSLGGICMKSPASQTAETKIRHLLGEGGNSTRGYVHCDAKSPYYGMLDCDCDNFDIDANAGSFACNYTYCFGGVSECCADTCANITLSYTSAAGAEGDYNYEACYNFQTPYEQSFCYGHSGNKANGESSCFGLFNGVNCDSCSIESAYCTMFDCGNTGLGTEEQFCVEDFYPPILTSCYADCATCSICPDSPGRTVVNPNVSVGFTGVTCGHLDYLGSTGFWGTTRNETCTNLVDAVKFDCCTPTSESPTEVTTRSPVAPSSAPAPTASPVASSSVPGSTVSPTASNTDPAPTISPIASTPNQEPTTVPIVSIPDQEPSTSPMASSNSGTTSPEESTTQPVPPDFSGGAMACTIRIQTAMCQELLVKNAELIPCDCNDKCIAFVNDKFEKCDDGTSIAGSGSIVAGCTFDMVGEDTFSNCSDVDFASDSAYGKFPRQSSLYWIAMASFTLLAGSGMCFW